MDNARTAWELSGVRPFPLADVGRGPRRARAAPWRWGFRLVLTLVLTPVLSLLPSLARATDDALRAAAILDAAEKADAELDFPRALTAYQEGLRLDPSTPRAMRAEARAAILRARSEADFVPLARLERIRRDPRLSSSGAAVDGLVRDAASWPAGLVRVEAWTLAAEAYANRLDRPADAAIVLELVLRDPHAEPAIARKAARDLVSIALARNDIAAAERAVALAGGRADDKLARDVARIARRKKLHVGSIAVLVLLVSLAIAAFARAARAGRGKTVVTTTLGASRLAIGYAAYVAIAGALLASGYEEGTAKPFLYFGLALAPLLLFSRAWASAGSTKRLARTARSVTCALGAFASAFLVLEAVDVSFLEGLGL